MEAAGFSPTQAFDLNISLSACYIIGGMICWLLMPRFGRATIYMSGLTFMFCCLVVIGGLGFTASKSAQLAIGILLVISTLANMITIGPVCYPIVAETPSGKLRYKTISIGRFVYNLTGIFNNSVTPRMLSPLGKSDRSQCLFQSHTNNVKHGTGAPRLVFSTLAPTFCATSGVGSACQRPRTVLSEKLI